MNRQDVQLGQLFMVGFDGMTVDAAHPVVEEIVRHRLGGVILFDRNVDGSRQNIRSPEQLRELIGSLQSYAETPLLVAVDQEGGRVCRLKEQDGFQPTVSARLLGEQGSADETYRHAALLADAQAACGINMNLAPVVDLDLNRDNPIIGRYDRSYGSLTSQVVSHAAAFIAAHHDRGIACCLKHFPGHGSAAADSHLGFVDISEQWQEIELEPYVQLFAAGFADSVMTAHVVNRQLDPGGLPATLSEAVINGLLRNRIGFSGVVISDDLQMRAISDRWSFEESVQRAVLAGVDLLIVGNNLVREQDIVVRGTRAIEELLENGRYSEERLRAALNRIAILKQRITGERPWSDNQPIT